LSAARRLRIRSSPFQRLKYLRKGPGIKIHPGDSRLP
jgi:hypothetical protein